MAFSSAEIASNKDGVIVVLISEIQVDFLISFESLWVELCCLEETLLIEGEHLCETSGSSCGLSGQFREERDLAEVLIYLQFLDISVRLLLHYHYCSFRDEIHFGSLLVFLKDMVVHGEGLIEEEKGDL